MLSCTCAQVLPGSTEPAVLRDALHASLPQAPPSDQQPVQYPAMLYTTVGRLLSPPRRPDSPGHPGMVRTKLHTPPQSCHTALLSGLTAGAWLDSIRQRPSCILMDVCVASSVTN